ncbi:MAG: ABC transporter substrate-binding protein, partial [Dehalococcoidia bacterium]
MKPNVGRLRPISKIAILAIFTAVVLIAAACDDSTPTAAPTATYPLTIVDGNGDAVTLEAPPLRIVAIDGAAVEVLFAIGEGHRIIGTHDFVSYPPETADIAKVGGAFALDFEKIAALEPDLIYIFFSGPL